jgi:hypothetical protein
MLVSLFLQDKMLVKIGDDTKISFYETKGGVDLTFGFCGVNEIYSIKELNYYDGLFFQLVHKESNHVISGSDWIGPYLVTDTESELMGDAIFTGGWHGSNGDTTGEPTAKCSDFKILIDGEQVSQSGFRFAKKIGIQMTNYILAYNGLEDYVIEEKLTYTITRDRKIETSITTKALKDIDLEKYYGLQLIVPTGFDLVTYYNKDKAIGSSSVKNGEYNASTQLTDRIVLEDLDSNHFLSASLVIDESFSFQDAEFLADENPYAFTTGYGKSYFSLVNGKKYSMKRGETMKWKGIYELK